ncbi:MAG: HEAT repeat domain-containing protein [Deltaproteobacteria bacterium]|nr:HEAT repeat domain-containing protein [Deltaproteobacteria bacterium]
MTRGALLLLLWLPGLAAAQTGARPRIRLDVAALTADLESGDLERMRRALSSLGASGSAGAVPALSAFIRRGPPGALLLPAIDALGALGRADTADALAPLLRHRRPEVRARAAVALAPLKSDSVSRALVVALGDPHESVRGAAAQALATAGTAEAVEPLLRAVEAGSLSAAPAVGAIGGAAHCDRLIEMSSRVGIAAVLPAFRLFLLRRDVPERQRLELVDRLASSGTPEIRVFLESLREQVPRAQRRLREKIAEVLGVSAQ